MSPDTSRNELIITLRMHSNRTDDGDTKHRSRIVTRTMSSSSSIVDKYSLHTKSFSSLEDSELIDEKRTIFGSYWSSDMHKTHLYDTKVPSSLSLDPTAFKLIDRAISTSQTIVNDNHTNATVDDTRRIEQRSIIFQRRNSSSDSMIQPEKAIVINKRRTLSDSSLVLPLQSCLRRGRFSCKKDAIEDLKKGSMSSIKSAERVSLVRFNLSSEINEFEKPKEFWGSDNWINYFEYRVPK